MTQENSIELGENHKRSVTTTLALLDEMLCEFDEYARGRERHGVVHRERNTLTGPQRKGIRAEIAAMRKTIRELKETLNLPDEPADVAHHIWGRASAFWEVLVETESKHLRRYGEVDPALKDYLDPRIQALIEHLLTLVDLSRTSASARAAPPGTPNDSAKA